LTSGFLALKYIKEKETYPGIPGIPGIAPRAYAYGFILFILMEIKLL
jgi:hypothetical protein